MKHLFNPVKIGSMTVTNRLVMPAMGIHFGVDEKGNVTPQLSEYYAARANGDVGVLYIWLNQLKKRFLSL